MRDNKMKDDTEIKWSSQTGATSIEYLIITVVATAFILIGANIIGQLRLFSLLLTILFLGFFLLSKLSKQKNKTEPHNGGE